MNLVEVDFQAWPKTPRLFRDCTITEKIDGTNGAIIITPYVEPGLNVHRSVEVNGVKYAVGAQSRNRIITPDADNAGFAGWVFHNAEWLVEALGAGRHFGEWWGHGIQRGYGKSGRTFSLFNTGQWGEYRELFESNSNGSLSVVPQLYIGPFDTDNVRIALAELDACGSEAAPGWMQPEGVCVFHHGSRTVFKALIENDHEPKSARFADLSRAGFVTSEPESRLALVA